jgi:hypothetical protein
VSRRRILFVLGALGAMVVSLLPATDVAAATPAVQIVRVQYDSPGKDTGTNGSLNAEYVVIKNTSSRRQVLTGWTLRDRQNHAFKFPTFTLGGGRSVTVHTGKGAASSTNRYYNRTWYVWNNTGDAAILRNASGTQVSACSWTATGRGYKSC